MIIDRLLTWLNNFNESDYDPSIFPHQINDDDLDRFTNMYRNVLKNVYVKRANKKDGTNFSLRPSMLGKPAIVVAYQYYHPGNAGTIPNPNVRMEMIGYFFEQWLAVQLTRLGIEFEHDVDTSITIKGVEIKGHIDFLIHLDDGFKVILECKELSDFYHSKWYGKKWSKPDDDRGYITQASIYSTSLDCPIMWILGNRGNGQIGVVFLSDDTKKKCMNRVEGIVDVVAHKTSTWEECFKYMEPEEPNVTKKGLTVPFGMKPLAKVVYEMKGSYIVDYKYPPGYECYKPDIKEVKWD